MYLWGSRWLHLSQLPSLAEMEALTNDLGIIDQCYQHLRHKKSEEEYLDAYKYTFSRRGWFLLCCTVIVSSVTFDPIFIPFFRGLDWTN